MRGCLFTLLLGAVAIALLVAIGLPQVYAGVLTGALTAAGLQADDTTVNVESDPPTDLLGLHADTVTVTATDATFREMAIGSLHLELRDVAVLDRTAEGVEGTLSDVTVTLSDGAPMTLEEISIEGAGDSISATTVVDGAEAEALIADAVEERVGTRPTSVSLSAPDTLAIDAGVDGDRDAGRERGRGPRRAAHRRPGRHRRARPAAREQGPADQPHGRARDPGRRPAPLGRPLGRAPRVAGRRPARPVRPRSRTR